MTGFLTLFGHVGKNPKFIQRVLLGGGGGPGVGRSMFKSYKKRRSREKK